MCRGPDLKSLESVSLFLSKSDIIKDNDSLRALIKHKTNGLHVSGIKIRKLGDEQIQRKLEDLECRFIIFPPEGFFVSQLGKT